MKAIETLIREHQCIGRLVDALETYARRIKQARGGDASQLAEFAAVFTEYGECLHHEKEESILLPALTHNGASWDTGPLPEVRRQHRQEAYLIDVLRQAGERASSWSDEDRRHIAAAAQALVEFQRGHHLLETTRLFPLVPQRLQEQQLQELQSALELFDQRHEQRRSAVLERMEKLIELYPPVSHSGVQSLLGGGGQQPGMEPAVGDDTEPSEVRVGIDL